MTTLKIQVIQELTMEDVANLVITAFEGGISYWCPSAKAVELTASGWQELTGDRYNEQRINGCGPYANPDFWDKTQIKRGYVLCEADEESGEYRTLAKVLTADRIGSALNKMVRDGTHNVDIVNRVLTGDYDAADADVVIQYCMFEEIVYG